MSLAQDHAHGPAAEAPRADHQRRLSLVLALTALYLLAEAAAGFLTGSLALLADAGHMLADVLGLALALVAMRFAQRPPTPARTYGFYRGEILAALFNSVLLFGIALSILFEAWQRLHEPNEIMGLPMLLVATGGLLVNLIGVRLLHGASQHSLNLRAAFLEVYSDLLGSVGVMVAGALTLLFGWLAADTFVSIGIALLILPRTWHLLRAALEVLLEAAPGHLDLQEIEAVMASTEGVESVHELHVWSISSGFVAMSAHVTALGRSSEDVLHDLQLTLRQRFRIEHSTLQVESIDHADDGACCTLDARCLIGPVASGGLARLSQEPVAPRAGDSHR